RWISGMAANAGIPGRAGAATSGVEALLNTARASFARRFVRPDGAGLFDVVDGPGGGDDASLRPNQLLAVSLPHAALDPATAAARSAVTACAPLPTSPGLRSLAPGPP